MTEYLNTLNDIELEDFSILYDWKQIEYLADDLPTVIIEALSFEKDHPIGDMIKSSLNSVIEENFYDEPDVGYNDIDVNDYIDVDDIEMLDDDNYDYMDHLDDLGESELDFK